MIDMVFQCVDGAMDEMDHPTLSPFALALLNGNVFIGDHPINASPLDATTKHDVMHSCITMVSSYLEYDPHFDDDFKPSQFICEFMVSLNDDNVWVTPF